MYKRDTKDYYLALDDPPVSDILVKFALDNLSGRILDFGGATGGYSKKLRDNGLEPICVDINISYLKKAAPITCVAGDTRLPFGSSSFDGAICYEIFEHLNNPSEILRELRRCVKGKLVVSVPNCEEADALIDSGMTYEHFMDLDHQNYFNKSSFNELLAEFYENVEIHEIMPVEHFLYQPSGNLAGLLTHKILRLQLKLFRNLGLIKRRFYNHLVAICGTDEK